MAYTTIDKPSDYFNTVLYTGTGSEQTVSGVNFQPDWTWLKSRSNGQPHVVSDSVRGATKQLYTADTQAETSYSQYVKSFNSDGFVLGTDAQINQSSQTFVSWNWKAGGSASSNEDGSINTTSTSVNQTAGFSISTWTGTGSNATVGHGLGAVPKVIITKARSDAYDWYTYHASIGNTKNVYLNLTNAESSASTSFHNNTNPTSSVWTAGGGVYNVDYTFVTYAFAEKQGYSKFGSYTSANSHDSTFVYLGFKPSMIIFKNTSYSGGSNWHILDRTRYTFNGSSEAVLEPDTNDAENYSAFGEVDFLSNGFKIRNDNGISSGGYNHIYMAFAEQPFVTSTGVPATAR
jgi:hypothetical protein